jgi:hypothetical protein
LAQFCTVYCSLALSFGTVSSSLSISPPSSSHQPALLLPPPSSPPPNPNVLIIQSCSFTICLYYSPSRPRQKGVVIAIYITFLFISIIPGVFETTLPPPGDEGRDWFSALFGGYHVLYINPVVTAIAIAAFLPQARETLSRPDRGALSLTGLATQAVVFAIVAACWPFRMTLPSSFWHSKPFGWYQLIGWATADNGVFAVVQAVLWWIAMRCGRGNQEVVISGERSPLLES